MCDAVVMKRVNNAYEYLGAQYSQNSSTYDDINLSENALRLFLEERNIIKGETYIGDHVLVKYTDSSGMTSQSLLSQPAKKGKGGIWCIERTRDTYGNVYLNNIDTDLPAKEYYQQLQVEVDNGKYTKLLNYEDVAYEYIAKCNFEGAKLDVQFIKNASVEDFEKNPSSSLRVNIIEIEQYADLRLALKYRQKRATQGSAKEEETYYDINRLLPEADIKVLKNSKLSEISIKDFIQFVSDENNKDVLYEIVVEKDGVSKISQVDAN